LRIVVLRGQGVIAHAAQVAAALFGQIVE
jgi:hypothetical protein